VLYSEDFVSMVILNLGVSVVVDRIGDATGSLFNKRLSVDEEVGKRLSEME